MIYLLLFWEFCKVSVFCVGGGYASMPLIQAGVVDGYHWLTMSEFVDVFTISQMTPGPIGINAATFAGMKTAGLFGGVAATVGFVVPSLCLGITLAKIFLKYGNIGPVRGALNGLRPAVVGLICAASIDFILLALWNTEELPVHWNDLSSGGAGAAYCDAGSRAAPYRCHYNSCRFGGLGTCIGDGRVTYRVGILDCRLLNLLYLFRYGRVSEWFKELVLKTSDTARYRGFESHPFRQ